LKTILPFILVVLLQACGSTPKTLPVLNEKQKAQVRDGILRYESFCDGRKESLVFEWKDSFSEEGEDFYTLEIICSLNQHRQYYRAVIKNGKLNRVEEFSDGSKKWVTIKYNWKKPQDFGFVENIKADTVYMLDVGEKFNDRVEMFKGNVELKSKNMLLYCDMLYWRNSNQLLRVPGRFKIHQENVADFSGKDLEMQADGEKWIVKGMSGYYYNQADSL